MTSLAYIFTSPRQVFLRHLGCKRMTRSHFAGGVSEQGDMQKGSFNRMIIVIVLGFYVPPTAKVIWRRDLGLKSHPKDFQRMM